MSAGKHRLTRAVKVAKSLGPRGWTAAGGLAAAGITAGTLLLGGTAGAVITPTTTYTGTGVAGFYAAPNANRLGNGDHITGVRATFYLRKAAENNSINLGVELCRYQNLSEGDGAAAVLFTQWDPAAGVYDVYAGHSTSLNCLAAQGDVSGATVIDTIPAGHTVQLEITVSSHHTITYVDSDQTTLTGGRTTFGGFTFGFDRGGFGANGQNGLLTTPANIKVASFTSTDVRDGSGWAEFNRSGLTRYDVNKVVDTTSGTGAGGVLITPGTPGTDSFPLYMGQLSNS